MHSSPCYTITPGATRAVKLLDRIAAVRAKQSRLVRCTARLRSGAGQPVQPLAGAALGGFGVTGAEPGLRQVRPRLDEAFFEVADLRLQPVLRRCGLGGWRWRRSHRPFRILVILPPLGRALGCLPRQPLLFARPRAALPPCAAPRPRAAAGPRAARRPHRAGWRPPFGARPGAACLGSAVGRDAASARRTRRSGGTRAGLGWTSGSGRAALRAPGYRRAAESTGAGIRRCRRARRPVGRREAGRPIRDSSRSRTRTTAPPW